MKLRDIRFLFYPEMATQALKLECTDTLLLFLAIKAISNKLMNSRNVFTCHEMANMIRELLEVSETRSRQILEAGNGRFWRLGRGKCGLVSYEKIISDLADHEALPSKPVNLAFNDLFTMSPKGTRPTSVFKMFMFACAVGRSTKPLTKRSISNRTGQSERTIARLNKNNPFLRVHANMTVLGTFVDRLTARQFCRDTYIKEPGVFILHTHQNASVVKRIGNSHELIGFDRMGYRRRPTKLKTLCGYQNIPHDSKLQSVGYLTTRHGESQIWKPVKAAEIADDARLLQVDLSYV